MEIIYEDNHIIAVNKKVGEIVQGDKTGDEPLVEMLKAYVKQKYNKPGNVFMGVVHRIDRPVSGVIIFARTSKALSRLNEMLRGKEIEKHYWAIVKQKPRIADGKITHHLVRNQTKNKSTAHINPVHGSKEGSLSFRLLASSDNYHLLEIDLHTGRHHQIRAQLAKIGSPVKGDLKYGFARSDKGGGISLHAREVKFIHPVSKEEIHIVAPPPPTALWEEFVHLKHKQID